MRRFILLLTMMAATLVASSGAAWALYEIGTNGPDTLKGTNGSDNLLGRGGNDALYGFDGRDNLLGGARTGSSAATKWAPWVETRTW